jgi:phosphoglycerate dehydrogenase-like enzyme
MNKITIYHDFNLELKLYSIPNFFIYQIKKEFPNVCFQDIDSIEDKDNVKIYFGNRINNKLIKQYKNLKWIHLGCVGYDSIDLDIIKSRNILMTNSGGLLTNSMVELALNFITSFSRGMQHINYLRHHNILDRKNFDKHYETVTNLTNQKVLICGYGAVGSKLAKILENLDMHIYTVSRSKLSKYKNFSIDDLERIIPEVNYIVNLLPLSCETKHLFDSKLFSKMKNVNFINLGRGQTVNEEDLLLAINNNNLNAAALDVFEKEPLSKESKLLNNQKIILTPHIAGLDSKYWNRQLDLFKYNLSAYLKEKNKLFKNKIS